MKLSALLHEICQQATEQLQQAATLPPNVCFHFDAAREASFLVEAHTTVATSGGEQETGGGEELGRVQKTIRRTVVSLQHGRIQACETVRQPAGNGHSPPGRSARLAELVPSGGRYSFDLIAHVGTETYLRGRSLQDVREELLRRQPAIDMPISTIWDQQQKFLFYLGRLHWQAAPCLREYLSQHAPVTWLLDGTMEPETSVFLGIEEAAHGLFLGNWKIPSENLEDIVPCLRQAADQFGSPDRVLHDLSPTMSGACEQALPGVSHFVCHQHLARDVGEDLSEAPQAALCQRLRTLKLQYRLKEQRRGQKEWLRQRLASPADLVLTELLAGRAVEVAWNDTLAREALLAFHFWILDYRSDGRRRGFPFDPYLLYLHRRLVRAGEAVDRLLSQAPMGCGTHLDKYWGHILPEHRLAAGERWQRTTNQLEGDWNRGKRRRRRTHGREKLTRDFQSLPEEYSLIPNLENETYLQLVLDGTLESLPAKLAHSSRDAGSFDAWRRRRRPRLLGELPRRLLRVGDFVEHLLEACIDYCQSPTPRDD